MKAVKSGLDPFCRSCRLEDKAEYRKKRGQPVQPAFKVCRTCQRELPTEAFSPEKMTRGGLRSDCKACCNARQRERFAQNPEKREEERLRCQRKSALLRLQKEALIAEGLMVRPKRGPRPRVPLVPQAPEV
ncbi:MAG: hypothetical protein V4671_06400 [Armatimonadota bacterium]